jgi:hypothetical protein
MLVVSFALLLPINLLQRWASGKGSKDGAQTPDGIEGDGTAGVTLKPVHVQGAGR